MEDKKLKKAVKNWLERSKFSLYDEKGNLVHSGKFPSKVANFYSKRGIIRVTHSPTLAHITQMTQIWFAIQQIGIIYRVYPSQEFKDCLNVHIISDIFELVKEGGSPPVYELIVSEENSGLG